MYGQNNHIYTSNQKLMSFIIKQFIFLYCYSSLRKKRIWTSNILIVEGYCLLRMQGKKVKFSLHTNCILGIYFSSNFITTNHKLKPLWSSLETIYSASSFVKSDGSQKEANEQNQPYKPRDVSKIKLAQNLDEITTTLWNKNSVLITCSLKKMTQKTIEKLWLSD